MTHDEAEREYARLLHEMQDLFDRGGADTPEHDAICDAMDRPWRAMSPEGIARTDRLSAALYERDATAPL